MNLLKGWNKDFNETILLSCFTIMYYKYRDIIQQNGALVWV